MPIIITGHLLDLDRDSYHLLLGGHHRTDLLLNVEAENKIVV